MEMKNLNSPENLMCMRGLIQYIRNPFVKAFTTGLGCSGDSSVNNRWNAQGEFAGDVVEGDLDGPIQSSPC